MRIRYKMLLILGLITLVLMAALTIFGQKAMLDGISASENEHSIDNAQRFINNLNIEITNIHNTASDWAEWDDTYTFVENNNTIYIESNLPDGTFEDLQLNLMLFYDMDETLVFGKMFDLSEQKAIPLNVDTLSQVRQNEYLFTEVGIKEGLILVDEVPMIVAAHSILTSLEEGPSHGTLIMGRYLDEYQLMLLSLSTGLPLSYELVNSTSTSNDFKLAKASLSVQQPIFALPLNETCIAGYALLNVVEGQPLLIVRVDDYRTEYTLGTAGLIYSEIFFAGIALCVFVAIAVLLDKLVVSRLTYLSNTVTKIRPNKGNLRRVKVQGNDELSTLSQNINGMLDVIEQNTFTLEHTVAERTKELAENKKQLESILQASPDAIIAADLNGNLIECNARVTELSGFTHEDLVGKPGLNFLVDRSCQDFAKEVVAVFQNKGPVRCETYFMKKDGSEIPVEFSVSLVKDEADHPIGVVGIIRDLSEKKLLEQRLLRSERLAAIGELAGMVAHDLRNPLAAIRNADYIIKKKSGNRKNSDLAPMIEIIDKSIDHANAIITDLLEYSKKLRLDIG
jgi:PAS domain S-box-containing protein